MNVPIHYFGITAFTLIMLAATLIFCIAFLEPHEKKEVLKLLAKVIIIGVMIATLSYFIVSTIKIACV